MTHAILGVLGVANPSPASVAQPRQQALQPQCSRVNAKEPQKQSLIFPAAFDERHQLADVLDVSHPRLRDV